MAPDPFSPAVLRPGALDGLVLAATGAGTLVDAARAAGAEVISLPEDLADDAALEQLVGGLPRPGALVVDGAELFAAAGLRGALDGAWHAVRAVATAHWIDAAGESHPGGKPVFVGPAPGAGAHAGAARAGLENLSRSLSTEWTRYGITPVALLPADATPPEVLAELVAFLVSPAGAYHSGSTLTLTS